MFIFIHRFTAQLHIIPEKYGFYKEKAERYGKFTATEKRNAPGREGGARRARRAPPPPSRAPWAKGQEKRYARSAFPALWPTGRRRLHDVLPKQSGPCELLFFTGTDDALLAAVSLRGAAFFLLLGQAFSQSGGLFILGGLLGGEPVLHVPGQG